MVVPKSSHDRSCSKESSQNVPSTITISESAFQEKQGTNNSEHTFISITNSYNLQNVNETGMGPCIVIGSAASANMCHADSEIVMVDGTFWDDSFEQDLSWDDFGTTISGI